MTILKEYKINYGLSQEEMAQKLKCSLPAYRNYENGKRTMPHDILINFLRLRARKEDLHLAEMLEDIYEKDVKRE